jgi:uncharacterized protein
MDQVIDNPGRHRLELMVGDQMAELVYQVQAGYLVLVHTEVPTSLEGHGLGGRLVQAALDRAVNDDLVVVPWCPFARRWLRSHPDAVGSASIDWDLQPS